MWFALPETKGATLEEMDRVFKSHAGREDAIMLRQALADVGLSEEFDQIAASVAVGSKSKDEVDSSPVETV